MSRPIIKICGINSEAALTAAATAGAEFVGLVFFPASPRFVTAARAAALAAGTGGPKRVGLFVAPADEEVAATLSVVPLDGLQIYADAARCRALAARYRLPVWRAAGIATPEDLPLDDEGLAGHVIEAKAPPGAGRPGGNAMVLDWSLLAGWRAPGFWLLGGGLNAGNVAEALRLAHPPGLDVSSGVETAPGQKSPELIRQFAQRARQDAREPHRA